MMDYLPGIDQVEAAIRERLLLGVADTQFGAETQERQAPTGMVDRSFGEIDAMKPSSRGDETLMV